MLTWFIKLIENFSVLCPFCQSDTDVVNSRSQKRTNGVWRRRHCTGCDRIFTSVEKADLAASVRVKKRSGALEPLSEAKLGISLYLALSHYEKAADMAVLLSQTVVIAVLKDAKTSVISSEEIYQHTVKALKRFDASAAIRYAAFKSPLKGTRDVRRALKN